MTRARAIHPEDFSIVLSQRRTHSPCGICNRLVPPPAIWLRGAGFPELLHNDQAVCPDCGIEHCRTLAYLVVVFFTALRKQIADADAEGEFEPV
jgi:hypothetical protein